MKQKKRAPGDATRPGAQETFRAFESNGSGFASDCNRKHFAAQSTKCARCRRRASRRGAMRASVTRGCGCIFQRFLCARCIADLQGYGRAA